MLDPDQDPFPRPTLSLPVSATPVCQAPWLPSGPWPHESGFGKARVSGRSSGARGAWSRWQPQAAQSVLPSCVGRYLLSSWKQERGSCRSPRTNVIPANYSSFQCCGPSGGGYSCHLALWEKGQGQGQQAHCSKLPHTQMREGLHPAERRGPWRKIRPRETDGESILQRWEFLAPWDPKHLQAVGALTGLPIRPHHLGCQTRAKPLAVLLSLELGMSVGLCLHRTQSPRVEG